MLARENQVLKDVARQLRNEVRFLRNVITSHGPSKHTDIMERPEGTAESSTGLDAWCSSVLADGLTGGARTLTLITRLRFRRSLWVTSHDGQAPAHLHLGQRLLSAHAIALPDGRGIVALSLSI
jgi:hypothetical protein